MRQHWNFRIKLALLASLVQMIGTTIGHAQSDFVKVAPEPKSYAWWLRAEFHPFETKVRGIPVGAIRKSWCKATEFRKDLFPAEAAPYLEHSGGLAFSADGFFDGSRTRQTALIGVYETCTGERGSFLLVFAHPPGRPTKIMFVHEIPDHQFGMLTVLPDSTIQVFHCMECDNTTKFRWNKSRRRFVQLSPDEQEGD
jgi:hypothetical protein